VTAPLAVVTGASGFVGSHVVDELLRHGARVRCLVRRTSSRRWLEGKPVELFEADLSSLPRLSEAVRGARWIVHAAGLTRARSAAEYNAANVGGTEMMLRAALEAGPDFKRFLYVGSQAAAGPSSDGRPVTEEERPEPVSSYGLSKLRAEQLVLLMRGRLPVTVFRPPAVYGPRDDAILRYFLAVKRHLRPELKRGARFSVVFAEDLARAARLALTDDRAAGGGFFVSEPDETDYGEMGDLVARAMGTWTVAVHPPGWLLHAGALVAELVGAVSRRPPVLSREKLREITSGEWICSSTRIRSVLGWEPQVSLPDGVERTARWYREARWL
jgi:nucleoside-diphosphate-sugar epimerase